MPGQTSSDQKTRTKLRNELYKGKSEHSQYQDEIKLPGLLQRWPTFLQLEYDLPTPTKSEALAQMRIMCPGRAGVTVEEIAAEETTYTTPAWKGRTATTDVEPRDLSPEEV